MNEQDPPLPPKAPLTNQNRKDSQQAAPNFWAMFGLGVMLLILSCALCFAFQTVALFGFGTLLAVVTIFFAGYRGVFIGFLAGIGLSILIAAITCGAMLASHHGGL